MAFERVAALDELWDGDLRAVDVGGVAVLLVRLGADVVAYADRCAHLGVPMSFGSLSGRVLTCSAHHYQYDAATGQGINPRTARLERFPVEVRGGDVFVDVAGRA